MEIFTYLGILWIALQIFDYLSSRANRFEMQRAVREKLDRTIRMVNLEEVPGQNGLILAYDVENNQFLGQGTSVDEIKENIMKRFPERIFLLDGTAFSALPNFEVKQK